MRLLNPVGTVLSSGNYALLRAVYLLKFDIVDRLGLESVFEFESATVLCRDLLLDVMLFLLGEFSLLRLLLPRLPLAEDSLNMDMEFLRVKQKIVILDMGIWQRDITRTTCKHRKRSKLTLA